MKLGLLALSQVGAGRLFPDYQAVSAAESSQVLARVAAPLIYLYREPSFKSERVGKAKKDELLPVLELIYSSDGTRHNRLWYRLSTGYAHSGRVQRVDPLPPNSPPAWLPAAGCFGEITVPYTDTQRFLRQSGYRYAQSLYRLYYGSIHHITALDEGPDGTTWCRLTDTLLGVEYGVPAAHIRPLPAAAFAPLSTDVAGDEKRILVSLATQSLTAYEGQVAVYQASISSGIHTEQTAEDALPTDTPTGSFRIQLKMPSRHMGEGEITDDHSAYELLGVPWTMVFHKDGYALHGTYWHNNFGVPMSHGCVNLRNSTARWLFRWTEPVFTPNDWYVKGNGTRVQIV